MICIYVGYFLSALVWTGYGYELCALYWDGYSYCDDGYYCCYNNQFCCSENYTIPSTTSPPEGIGGTLPPPGGDQSTGSSTTSPPGGIGGNLPPHSGDQSIGSSTPIPIVEPVRVVYETLSTAAIVGIVFGAVVFTAIVVTLCARFMFGCGKTDNRGNIIQVNPAGYGQSSSFRTPASLGPPGYYDYAYGPPAYNMNANRAPERRASQSNKLAEVSM